LVQNQVINFFLNLCLAFLSCQHHFRSFLIFFFN
jgi:hypothetical protein